MNTNTNMFDELFGNAEFSTFACVKSGNTLEAARGKVVRALQESKALFEDAEHTYLKNGRTRRPAPCFARLPDGRFTVRATFSRITLSLRNGHNSIVCKREEVALYHDRLIKYIASGALDDQIHEAQERYRRSQTKKRRSERQ